eukprot:SAG31_NODE_51_length_30464_cov_16.835628_7_plen_100_part_00
MHFDKITARISKLCYGLDPQKVQAVLVAQKVCAGVYPNVTTSELDDLAAETAAYMSTGACPRAAPHSAVAAAAAAALAAASPQGCVSTPPAWVAIAIDA